MAGNVTVNRDLPPSYEECCAADHVTVICWDQDAAYYKPTDQLTRTAQPAPIGYAGVENHGHQPFFVHPHRYAVPSSAWVQKVNTFEARSYTTSQTTADTSPRQLSATTLQLVARTENQLPSIAPIVNVDGREVELYKCQVVFGCVVMWIFCNCLFGLVAYAFASHAEVIKYSEPRTARKYANCSIYVSLAGIVVSLSAILVLSTMRPITGSN